MRILDITDEQLAALMDQGMGANLPPELRALTDDLLELALRLREIKKLATDGATNIGGQWFVPAETVIRLLDGHR